MHVAIERRQYILTAYSCEEDPLWNAGNRTTIKLNQEDCVMITYDKLWETLREKNITQYRLIKDYGISSGQLHRIKKNMDISTHTINMFCKILNCRVEDIVEYIDDPNEKFYLPGDLYRGK